jgi:hypothetical protein
MIGSPIVPQREAIVQPRHQSPVLRDEFTLAVFEFDNARMGRAWDVMSTQSDCLGQKATSAICANATKAHTTPSVVISRSNSPPARLNQRGRLRAHFGGDRRRPASNSTFAPGDRNAVVHMLSVLRGPVQDGIGTPRDLTEQ